MNLNFEAVVSTYLRSQTGNTQWKFGGVANDKSACTTEKKRRTILWTKKI